MLLSNSSIIALMNNSSIFKILKRLIFSFLTLLQVLLAINFASLVLIWNIYPAMYLN